MKHYSRKPDGRLQALARKFEKMTTDEQRLSFKKSELLLLADYYEFEKFPSKALEVIDFGISQFQKSSELQVRKTRLLLYNYPCQQALESLDGKKYATLKTSQLDLLQLEILIVQGKLEVAQSVITALKYKYAKTRKILSEVYYLEALNYEKMRNFDLSFAALSEVLFLNPDHNDAKGRLWVITELSKKYEESIFLNQYLLQKEHYSAITWFNIGHAYYSSYQYEKAIEAFEFCLVVNEEFESAYLDLAEVSLLLGLFQKAKDSLEIAIEKFQINEIEIFIQYGESLLKCGDSRAARKAFQQGLIIDPLDPDILYLLGETYRCENNWEDAIISYSQALELDDAREEIHRSLGKVYFQMAEYKKAEQHLLEAIEYNPIDGEYRTELASFYLNIGEKKLSERILSSAVEEIPDNKLQYHHAAILMAMGEESKALEIMNEALQEDFQGHEEVFEFAPELIDNAKITSIINYYQAEQF